MEAPTSSQPEGEGIVIAISFGSMKERNAWLKIWARSVPDGVMSAKLLGEAQGKEPPIQNKSPRAAAEQSGSATTVDVKAAFALFDTKSAASDPNPHRMRMLAPPAPPRATA